MTPAQDKWLREFAEALGWETGWWCEKCHAFVDGIQVTYHEDHETCGYPVIEKTETGIVTPDGQAYLVARLVARVQELEREVQRFKHLAFALDPRTIIEVDENGRVTMYQEEGP